MSYQEAIENVEVIQDHEHRLAELEDYIDSEDHETISISTRTHLVDLFRNALSSPEEMKRVLRIMNSLSQHPDPTVKLVLMERLPRLALLCCSGDRLDIINTHLWPMLLSCLLDKDEKVRKTSEVSLLVLIKGRLLEQELLDEQVCPCVIEISELYKCTSTVVTIFGLVFDFLKDMGSEMLVPYYFYLSLSCLSWRGSCIPPENAVFRSENVKQSSLITVDCNSWQNRRSTRQIGCDLCLLIHITATFDKSGFRFDRLLLREEMTPCNTAAETNFISCASHKLMGKMAPLIGKEATKKYFLDRFIHLCSDEEPLVREMCAKSLGDICIVLGTELTEKYLLPLFVQLCRDENWMVRASCTEVCLSVSCSCSLSARKTILAAAFTDLLVDTKQCVRVSAYRFLGAFICTFADPSLIKLDYDEGGELIFMGQEGYEFRIRNVQFNSSTAVHFPEKSRDENLTSIEGKTGTHCVNISNSLLLFVENGVGHFNLQGISSNQKFMNIINQPLSEISWLKREKGCSNSRWDGKGSEEKEGEEEADDLFNTFRFWRTPLPELDPLDLEHEQDEIRTNLNILDNELSSLSEKLAECSNVDLEDIRTESVTLDATSPDSGWCSAETTPHVESVGSVASVEPKVADALECQNAKGECGTSNIVLPVQDVVPQLLLDYFISLTVPLDEYFDKDFAQDCAYCFPAVALILGPRNWPYIKNAYKNLSMNIQFKVRRTLVSSIHKLASILGEEIASEDLAPIFEGFIRDLDEVKIGALEHLADFLKLLKQSTRNAFLPRLKEFLDTDFDCNWRYREEFGEQLRLIINLFDPMDWLEYFKPLAILLLCDKVAAVRQKAVLLFVDLIVHLSNKPDFQEGLLYIMLKEFAEHTSWRRRQVFVLLCSEIAKQKALNNEDFCMVLLDHLLLLSKDEVPNIGLCVARCLALDIVSTGYVKPSSPYFTSVIGTLEILRNNEDPDIRYFASLHDENKYRKPFSNAPGEGAVIQCNH